MSTPPETAPRPGAVDDGLVDVGRVSRTPVRVQVAQDVHAAGVAAADYNVHSFHELPESRANFKHSKWLEVSA